MNKALGTYRVLAQTLLLAFTASAAADQISVAGANHVAVKITGFEQGQVHFRTAEGRTRSAWIDEIDLLIVEGGSIYDDFNEAERLLAGRDAEHAVVRYERASRLSEEFWPDLIASRTLMACDLTGRLDKTVTTFLRVLGGRYSGPQTAARLIPRTMPTRRDGKVQRAVEQLGGAVSQTTDEAQRVLLELLRYEILRHTNDAGAAEARRRVVSAVIPEAARSQRTYAIQLAAMREGLRESAGVSAMLALESAIRACPDAVLPEFLLLKGQVLLRRASTRDDVIRAAWSLMRVAIHFPDDEAAPRALCGAAQALERIGRPDKAIELLGECLQHAQVESQTRQEAEAAMARLREVAVPE